MLKLPPNVTSPKSIAFDSLRRGPHTGVSDGQVLMYKKNTDTFIEFFHTSPTRTRKFCDGIDDIEKSPTCGMPLALDFEYRTGQQYACDPFTGVTVVGPLGGLAEILVPTRNGYPYRFLIAIDVARDGIVHFEEASSVYGLRDGNKWFQSGDSTGKLLMYNPRTRKAKELLVGLSGAIGVATDRDATFVLVLELFTKRIQRYWLKGEKAGSGEIFMTFEGGPNRINRNEDGDFWVAVNYPNKDPGSEV